jgi:MFS transporter, DHA1 family, multidrug resistance protein
MQKRWQRNLAALWIGQLMAMIAFSSVMPFLPLYVQQLGVTDMREVAFWAGILGSSAAISMAIMAPIWGDLADRHGRKLMLARSMFGGGVIVGLMSLVRSVHELLVLRTIQGTLSGTVTASRVLAVSIVPAERLGFAMGLMQMAIFVGSSAGPAFGGFLSDNFGYRTTFVFTGAALLLSGFAVVFFVDEKFVPPPKIEAKKGNSIVLGVRLVMKSQRLLAMIVSLFLVQVAGMVISPILPLFIQSLSGPDQPVASTAGIIMGATAASSAVAAVVLGRVSDRVGYRRILMVCAIGAGLLYVPQMFVRSTGELLVLRALLGLFMGGVMPTAMAIIGLITPPDSRGWVYGLTASASSLGNAIGPLLGASVAATLGFRSVFEIGRASCRERVSNFV